MQFSQNIVVELKITLRRMTRMMTDTEQTLHEEWITRLPWLKKGKEGWYGNRLWKHMCDEEVAWCLRCLSASGSIMLQVCYLQLCNLSPKLLGASQAVFPVIPMLLFWCCWSHVPASADPYAVVKWVLMGSYSHWCEKHPCLGPFTLVLLILVYARENQVKCTTKQITGFKYLLKTTQKYMCMEN